MVEHIMLTPSRIDVANRLRNSTWPMYRCLIVVAKQLDLPLRDLRNNATQSCTFALFDPSRDLVLQVKVKDSSSFNFSDPVEIGDESCKRRAA